jgi:hypothetical protein
MVRTELREHARQIGGHTTAVHMRRAIHATILVLAKIVPFASMGVRKHSVGFSNQLELFFIAALEPPKKKKKVASIDPTPTTQTVAPCLDDV